MSEDVVRSAFNDQNTLIITHLLHLLPLNARLGPVFLDKPRDWQCIGIHWIQRNSGTWACRNPSQVNHSSLNRTRRELQQYLFVSDTWSKMNQQKHITSQARIWAGFYRCHLIFLHSLEMMSNLKYHPPNYANTVPGHCSCKNRVCKLTKPLQWICTL